MVTVPYTLEQAELDISALRGQMDKLSEILSFNDSTASPNVPADGTTLFSSGGELQVMSADGNQYGIGTAVAHIAPGNHNQVVSSTTPVAVPDLVWQVQPVRYNLEGLISATCGAAAGVRVYKLTGPAISEIEIFTRYDQVNTATLVSGQTHSTFQTAGTTSAAGYNASGWNSQAQPGVGVVYCDEIRCSFTFTAAGTLQLLVAEGTASDPWTVNYGYLQLTPT